MRLKTIEKLCCPFDHGDLSLKIIRQDLQDNVLEGLLTCKICKRYYPIIKGVPIMNPDEYRERNLETPVLKRWEKENPALKINEFLLEN